MVPKARLALLSLLSVVALSLGVTFVLAGSASAANILANPGFESGTSGWTCTAVPTAVSTPVHSGSRALSATPTSSDNAQCSQTLAVSPNTAYKLSAWVQGSYVYLGVSGSATTSTWTPGTSGYSQLSLNFTTGSSTSLTVYLHGWYGQPTYFADDVSLDGPGTPPPTTPDHADHPDHAADHDHPADDDHAAADPG